MLRRSLALGLNLQLIWVRLLVFTQINQGQQNAVVIFKNNDLSNDNENYYHWSIAIPAMDHLISNLEHRMADRSHTEVFSLLTFVCLLKQFDIDLTVDKLIKNFGDDLQCIFLTNFRSELKLWVKQWETEMEKRKKRKGWSNFKK